MNIIKKINYSKFTRNILLITGGTAFAQILNILSSPILTRVYTPTEYGLISIFTAILSSLSFIGSLNYDMGIPIAKDDEEAINVFVLSLLIILLSTLTLSIILLKYKNEILTLLSAKMLIKYYYLIPTGLMLIAIYNTLTQWAYRKKNFKVIAKTKFNQSFLQNSVSVIFGLLGFGSLGLLLGRILGSSAGITTLAIPIWKNERSLFTKVKFEMLIASMKRFKNFPIFTTPRRYIGDITISLPVIYITALYGNDTIGLFSLANSIIQLPMNIIGTSISNVYYAECAELRYVNPRELKKLSNKLLRTLLIIGIPPLIITLLVGPQLFSLVFGSDWRMAGEYARLLSFVVFSRFVFKPISNIFDIFEKQKLSLYLNIFRLLLVLFVFGFSRLFKVNSFVAVSLYSLTMSLVYFLEFVLAKTIIANIAKY